MSFIFLIVLAFVPAVGALQAPREYVDYDLMSGSSPMCPEMPEKKNLVFIHIPKNAGSTIEDIAHKANLSWGRFGQYDKCKYKDFNFGACPHWHRAPRDVQSDIMNNYKEQDSFCVVRHPLGRAVSQYKWMVKETVRHGSAFVLGRICMDIIEKHQCDAKGLNACLDRLLEPYYTEAENNFTFSSGCHMRPQTDYLYGKGGGATCKHVLRFENLAPSFNELMKKFKLPMRLKADQGSNIVDDDCQLSVSDLNSTTLGSLKEVYSEDFTRLGYASNETEPFSLLAQSQVYTEYDLEGYFEN